MEAVHAVSRVFCTPTRMLFVSWLVVRSITSRKKIDIVVSGVPDHRIREPDPMTVTLAI